MTPLRSGKTNYTDLCSHCSLLYVFLIPNAAIEHMQPDKLQHFRFDISLTNESRSAFEMQQRRNDDQLLRNVPRHIAPRCHSALYINIYKIYSEFEKQNSKSAQTARQLRPRRIHLSLGARTWAESPTTSEFGMRRFRAFFHLARQATGISVRYFLRAECEGCSAS
ncbi:hypothetical protein ACJJTC_015652 [Scirpophaga incertulas]